MFLRNSFLLLFAASLAPLASGAPRITGGGAVNAASRIIPGLPDYGVAKGALFYLRGNELGPDETATAQFPLPGADGLGGTSIKVAVGGTTVDALMVASSARQVWAILPSSTPAGSGQVTLTYNGGTATTPIQVVDTAFGIFVQSGGSLGTALAFNGGSQLNQYVRTATPGQEVTLIGTGLGAITGDESNAVDASSVGGDVKVFVGGKDAVLVSSGRLGSNESANADTAKLPRGLAAIDQVTFRVPDGVSGCAVPVSVQTGSRMSNWATIAVSGDGSACADLKALGDLNAFFGGEGLKSGSISLLRLGVSIEVPILGSLETKNDFGSASFSKNNIPGVPASALTFSPVSAGNCMVIVGQLLNTEPATDGPIVEATPLDAGEALRVQGPKGSRTLKKTSPGEYADTIGIGTGAALPFPIPGQPAGPPEFLDPGEYTVDNGSGGADIPAFSVKARVGTPLTWTNQAQIREVNRTQALTVNWTGGSADSLVWLYGLSNTRGGSASFFCVAEASARQITVPTRVLASMPASAGGSPTDIGGFLFLANVAGTRVDVPGTDISVFSTGVLTGKSVNYR